MDYVEEYMIPVDKFPAISDESTLREAILTLDQVECEFVRGERPQRILLVVNAAGDVVGKLTPKDVIRGMEPNYARAMTENVSSLAANYKYIMNSRALLDLQDFTTTPWDSLCANSQTIKIKDFLIPPPPSQIVQVGDTLNKALNRFILGKHHSLFVTEDGRLVGVLRFTDVWKQILDRMKYVCCA